MEWGSTAILWEMMKHGELECSGFALSNRNWSFHDHQRSAAIVRRANKKPFSSVNDDILQVDTLLWLIPTDLFGKASSNYFFFLYFSSSF